MISQGQYPLDIILRWSYLFPKPTFLVLANQIHLPPLHHIRMKPEQPTRDKVLKHSGSLLVNAIPFKCGNVR